MLTRQIITATLAGLLLFVGQGTFISAQQAPPGGRAGAPPAPDKTKPHKLEVTSGTRARYKVTEQLAGISFPSEAVGTTEAITGAIVVNPDGTIGADSKLTVDLKTLASDQSMRDGYIQTRTLETDKFPTLVIVAKRAVGLPAPLPVGQQAQAGFQLITDMTLHGVTKETTWNVVATFGATSVGGRATTTINFADFKMTKPSLARLLSVDDKITLEIEFRCTRTAM
ncbi:MAG TPA: YceI family protein [Vicinamibacterales bacterium]|nr:YceI family protein [Vicinamibacterales bacterium]